MSVSFGSVDEKLAETEFFLQKLGEAGFDFFAARCYFSAFVTSGRSITYAMQKAMSGVHKFDIWYETKRAALSTDPIARFFHGVRIDLHHKGMTVLNGGSLRSDAEGNRIVRFRLTRGSSDCREFPEKDAQAACKKYFVSLTSLVYDCYAEFGRIIDPDGYYTFSALRKAGKSIEDYEEELGLPRGWTDVGEGRMSDRLKMLRSSVPDTEIDWIFRKYLGRPKPQWEEEDSSGSRK